MVKFQFTKHNGVANVGDIKELPIKLAQIYERLKVGEILTDEPKKTKTKKK